MIIILICCRCCCCWLALAYAGTSEQPANAEPNGRKSGQTSGQTKRAAGFQQPLPNNYNYN